MQQIFVHNEPSLYQNFTLNLHHDRHMNVQQHETRVKQPVAAIKLVLSYDSGNTIWRNMCNMSNIAFCCIMINLTRALVGGGPIRPPLVLFCKYFLNEKNANLSSRIPFSTDQFCVEWDKPDKNRFIGSDAAAYLSRACRPWIGRQIIFTMFCVYFLHIRDRWGQGSQFSYILGARAHQKIQIRQKSPEADVGFGYWGYNSNNRVSACKMIIYFVPTTSEWQKINFCAQRRVHGALNRRQHRGEQVGQLPPNPYRVGKNWMNNEK